MYQWLFVSEQEQAINKPKKHTIQSALYFTTQHTARCPFSQLHNSATTAPFLFQQFLLGWKSPVEHKMLANQKINPNASTAYKIKWDNHLPFSPVNSSALQESTQAVNFCQITLLYYKAMTDTTHILDSPLNFNLYKLLAVLHTPHNWNECSSPQRQIWEKERRTAT